MDIKIVIGSWGSYNDCNSRAMGSKWLDLDDFTCYDDILDELEAEGFQLDGIDEELFIQDVEGLPCDGANWDFTTPEQVWDFYEATQDIDEDILEALLEIESVEEVKRLCDDGSIENFYFDGEDWAEHGENMLDGCEIPDYLYNYIDFASYGEEDRYSGYAYETSFGILCGF